ncbi:hypothetical protein [Leisingera methylohalidivorans]|uniref:Uncharacterized protein n=1 Tax=Leisingera methylohalidivorans DSM 14336 TaxID=999552 RepID=V9VX08_9RHOB|nr:hypothetical protein [Leisingera methylohalidivorans]AHD03271.1 hypothetical protein METH_18005 [Leisingera methylohalidivorans DSM 14336]
MRKLNEVQRVEVLNDYCRYLLEIFNRLWVCHHTLNALSKGAAVNVYRPVDIELCYLQLRKVFELMMFGSLLAQSTELPALGKKLRNTYKATQIVAHVRKRNPKFFPIPRAPDADTIPHRAQSNSDPHLEENEFKVLYQRALDHHLHANRNFGMCADQDTSAVLEIQAVVCKIKRLLKVHTLELSTGDLILAQLMNKETEKPHAQFLMRVTGPV